MAQLEFIDTRNYAPKNLGDVLILGLGVSGKAATQYCSKLLGSRVNSLTIYGGTSSDASLAFAQECRQQGIDVVFDTEAVEGSFDLCIASPGISQFSPFYESARSHAHEVISEVEFAWREAPVLQEWIAITGTNGKSTTTALAAHLLNSAGAHHARAVGNIGDACIDAVAESIQSYLTGSVCNSPNEVYVAEVSSYQLASTKLFAPDVAVMLGITPDHLSWHKSFEAYVQAKRNVFAHPGKRQGSSKASAAIFDASSAPVFEMMQEIQSSWGGPLIALGGPEGIRQDIRHLMPCENAAFLRDDSMLVVALEGQEIELIKAEELRIPGMHNVTNALAAAAAVLCLGAPVEGVREGLCSFTALEHRIEFCGEVAGVACYNDSKATNVDATLKALSAFSPKRPLVLLGGDDKGTDLTELVAAAVKNCKAVICFGAAGPRFAAAFERVQVDHFLVGNMEAALDTALGLAAPGDIVLLSPACASFDEFSNFEHRGRVFKDLVATRLAKQ